MKAVGVTEEDAHDPLWRPLSEKPKGEVSKFEDRKNDQLLWKKKATFQKASGKRFNLFVKYVLS